MYRAIIGVGAAAALVMAAMPTAAAGTSTPGTAATPTKVAAKASDKVPANKWGSYIVIMKQDPLAATIAQEDLNSTSAQRRKATLVARHDAAMKRAGLALGKKVQDYTAVLNGFSILASQSDAQKLAADPAVLLVMSDELRQKQSVPTATGEDEIAAGAGQTLPEFLGTDSSSTKGEGELLGVIDTGIWPEHPSFTDDGTYPRKNLDNARGGFPKCDFGRGKNDAAFKCNNKLVGARQMLKTYRKVVGVLPGEFNSARDDDGHGTHTASTAAGNADVEAWIYDKGRALDTTSGVAPRAQVVAYKALGSLGGFSSDLAAAIDQAVYDGVDVINYSVGGGPGLVSADAISFLYANRAGVHVATSAGNEGPDAFTIGGPADLPWVTTVGASTQPRFYAGTVKLGNGSQVLGSSVTLGSDADLPLVDADTLGNPLCLSESQLDDDAAYSQFAKAAKGAMVLCWRGEIGRSEKSLNVLDAGGKAMVLSNQTDDDNYFTDNFRVPTVMVDKSEGDVIAGYAAMETPTATITDTGSIRTFVPAPSMAVFSSRGPNPSASSIIKPDITAPGVQVLAGASPMPVGDDYEPGQLFQAIAGTSMSSPVMAGVFLLLDELYPTWTPAMVKSAAMTTAYQKVLDNDRSTDADPFDFGAGHVDTVPAFTPGLVYDAGFNDFLGFYCGSDVRNDVFTDPDATCGSLEGAEVPTTIENLNYPTIGVGSLAGVSTVTRTVTNVGAAATFTAMIQDPPGLAVEVSPAELILKAGETGTFRVTITNEDAPVNDRWRFGSLTWEEKGGDTKVRSNIAAYPTAISAPGLITGSGSSGSVDVNVTTGYKGTYMPMAGGLAPNKALDGDVSQDPDQTFDGCTDPQPGTTAERITVADRTTYLRLSYVLPTDDDIDLYLCRDDEVVAESTAGGTNELIELSHPESGDYTLYVHGWQVVNSPLAFSIDRWQVVRGAGTPELNVSATSADAIVGEVITVTAAWDDAPSGTSFGVIDHTMDGTDSYGQTVVQVTN